MDKHFMIDIEATGIESDKEDLLSIGLLETEFDDSTGFWKPMAAKEWFLNTIREPESEFAKEHMGELYTKCHKAPVMTTERLRWEVLDFMRSHGTTDAKDTFMMGWNASNFDMPFLTAKGVLFPTKYETGLDGTDHLVGDFHYRIYEIGGAVSVARDALKKFSRDEIIDKAVSEETSIDLPKGHQHDALYDCYRQLKILNGLIVLLRDSRYY